MNNGKICVSVCAEIANQFSQDIKRARVLGDFIELRFDCLNEGEIEKVEYEYDENYIRTFRPREQGGKRDLSLTEREYFWTSGEDYCGGDFEEDVVRISFYWLYKPVICSYHDFSKTLENITEIYERLKATEADVVKIAVQAEDATDGIAVWKLLERAKKDNKQIIPIAMGEAGKWTRILGLAHGAFMTYAALEAGGETAPGQFAAQDLIETYRVKELDQQTEIYGIVGNPVSHSLSPFMHNAAFRYHKLNAVYIPFAVKNLDEFIKKFVRKETREIELNFKGFSVTIPHKQTIIEHLDSIDETAAKIGAINTVKIVDGKLLGYNTDADGFIEPLRNAYGDLRDVKVAILGGGGAARACVYALKNAGAKVTIFTRDVKKARSLADEFEVDLELLNDRQSTISTFDIAVNATPLGTKGRLENETALTSEEIQNVKLVYDLVYNPSETRLIKEAKKAGVPAIGGLAMLVAQGIKQFEIWTELDAPLKTMSAAVFERLNE